MTEDEPRTTADPDDYAEMAEELARLLDAADRLRALGEAADVPAIERNAKRVADSATALADNLPPELYEE